MFDSRAAAILSVIAVAIPTAGSESVVSVGSGAGTVNESPAQRRDSPFAVGDVFPDLAFPSLEDGTPTRLSDFRGHKVMLHVFASW